MKRFHYVVKIDGVTVGEGAAKAEYESQAYGKIVATHGNPLFTRRYVEYRDVYDDKTFVRIVSGQQQDHSLTIVIVHVEDAADTVTVDLTIDQRMELLKILKQKFGLDFSQSDLNNLIASVEFAFQQQFGDEFIYFAEQMAEERLYGGSQ